MQKLSSFLGNLQPYFFFKEQGMVISAGIERICKILCLEKPLSSLQIGISMVCGKVVPRAFKLEYHRSWPLLYWLGDIAVGLRLPVNYISRSLTISH